MQEYYYQIFFRRLQIAIQFLTQIPVWIKNPPVDKDVGCSASYYPMVGLIVGGLLFSFLWILQHFFTNTPSSLLAGLVLTVWVFITGILHLNGLANSTNSFTDDNENSRTVAVVSIVLVLLLKWQALETLIELQLNWAIIFIPALARAYILLLLATTKYVSEEGLTMTVLENFPAQIHINTILFISAIVFIFSLGFWVLASSLIVFFMLKSIMLKKIDGCNSDSIGAMVEIIEMSSLIFLALFF